MDIICRVNERKTNNTLLNNNYFYNNTELYPVLEMKNVRENPKLLLN